MSNQNPGGQVCAGSNSAVDATDATGVGCGSLSWSHALSGFNPLTDVLTSAMLTLRLYDDSDHPGQALDLYVDLSQFLLNQVITNGTTSGSPFVLSLTVLGQLIDGSASVLLDTSKNGNHDFWFVSSTLDVQWQAAPVAAVPEPTTAALLTSGLVAIVAAARRRRRAGTIGR